MERDINCYKIIKDTVKNTAIRIIKLDHMKLRIFDGFDLKKLQLYVAQSNIISSHSVKIELDLEK